MATKEAMVAAATPVELVVPNRIDGPEAQAIERDNPVVSEATREHYEGEPADAKDEPKPSPRDLAMAEIYAKRAKQIEIENGESRRQQGEPEPVAEEEQAEPVVEAAAVEPATPAEPVKRKIKVNGAELEMSEDELIRAAQLGVASHQKFQEAAQLRQQAEEMVRRSQQHPGVSPETTRAAEPAKASTPTVDEAELNRLAQQLTYGDAEQSKAAIRRLLELRPGEGRADGPTPEQIVAEAERRALATLARKSALDSFASEHKDILDDRYLTYLAAQNVNALRAHYQQVGVPKSESELYAEAGKMVRDWKTSFVPKAEPDTKPTPAKAPVAVSTDRVERKRAASLQQPAATAGAKAKLEDNTPRPLTPGEIVNQMRLARRQPVFT